MGVVPAHIFQVVMFSGYTHALLRIDRARVRPVIRAQEYVLELHHARIGKQQGLVPTRHQRRGWDDCVPSLNEEINKSLPDFRPG